MPIVKVNDKGEFELVEVDLDGWKRTFRRLLLNGPPLSGKTTSLLTFPGTQEAKRHIVVAPGELGHSSIREDDSTKLYYWEFNPGESNVQYGKVWIQLQTIVNDVLSGKHGGVNMFAIDGLHKVYYVIMKAKGYGPTTDPREYTKYHEAFSNFMSPILTVSIVIFSAGSFVSSGAEKFFFCMLSSSISCVLIIY